MKMLKLLKLKSLVMAILICTGVAVHAANSRAYFAEAIPEVVPSGAGTVYAEVTSGSSLQYDGKYYGYSEQLAINVLGRWVWLPYSENVSFNLQTTPSEGYYFLKWTDADGNTIASSGSDNMCTVSNVAVAETPCNGGSEEAFIAAAKSGTLNEAEYRYKAIFAKLVCDDYEVFYPCDASGEQDATVTTLRIPNGVTAELIDNTDDAFSIISPAAGTPVASCSNDDNEHTGTISIAYNPTNSSKHTAKLKLVAKTTGNANMTDYNGAGIDTIVNLVGDGCEPIFTWPASLVVRSGQTLSDVISNVRCGNVETGQTVTLSSYNNTIISTSGNSLEALGEEGDTVTITASVVEDGYYKPHKESRVFTISSKAEQYISWNQSFMSLMTGTQNITLTAVAKDRLTDNQLTQTQISYTLSDVSPANAISYANGVLNIGNTPCTAKITAHSPAVDGYLKADDVVKEIKVRDAGACNSLVINETSSNVHNVTNSSTGSYIIQVNQSKPCESLTYHISAPKPDSQTGYALDVIEYASSNGTGTPISTKSYMVDQALDTDDGITIGENTKSIKFSYNAIYGNSDKTIEVSAIQVTQKTYIEYVQSEISQYVNIYTAGIIDVLFRYSDKQTLTVTHTASDDDIEINLPTDASNKYTIEGIDCGLFGNISVPLNIKPQTETKTIEDYVTITANDGTSATVYIVVNITMGDDYYFVGGVDGDANNWDNVGNWKIGSTTGATAKYLPMAANPVYICAAANLPTKRDVYSLTMETGGTLSVAPTGGLTVYQGGLSGTSTSNLMLQSSDAGTGYLRAYKETSTANATVQMYSRAYYDMTVDDPQANDAAFQYIGCPIQNIQTTAEHLFYKCWLYRWDATATTPDWASMGNSGVLKPFEGYALTQPNSSTGQTFTYSGQLVDFDDQDISLTGGSSDDGKFLCVANSYSAPIDITQFVEDDFDGLEKEIYVFNTGSYNAYGDIYGEGGTGVDVDDLLTSGQYITVPLGSTSLVGLDLPLVVPSMQGFFVKLTGTSGTLHFNYDRLVWKGGKTMANLPMFAPSRRKAVAAVTEDDLSSRVLMIVNGANRNDYLCLLESDRFTKDYDKGYDGSKEMGSAGNHQIYTNESAGQLMISATNELPGTMIGFAAPAITRNDQPFDTTFTYTIAFFNTLGTEYYLHDNVTGEEVAMVAGKTFTFTAASNTRNDARFTIKRESKVSTSLSNLSDSDSDIRLWTANDHLYVSVPDDATRVLRIFDMQGKQIVEQTFQGAYVSSLSILPQGVYMANVADQSVKFTK